MSAMALKRPAVAPAEGLLTEAVLKLACVVRAAARDPFRTLMVGGSLPLRKLTHRVAGALWPPNIEQLETEASAPSVK
jgi:hypothetical protein